LVGSATRVAVRTESVKDAISVSKHLDGDGRVKPGHDGIGIAPDGGLASRADWYRVLYVNSKRRRRRIE
jgi:hypothetical protein